MKIHFNTGHRLAGLLGIFLLLFIAIAVLCTLEFYEAARWLAAGGIVVAVAGAIFLNVGIFRHLDLLRKHLVELSRGKIPEVRKTRKTRDILGIEHAFTLHAERLKEMVAFSRKLSEGKLDGSIQTSGDSDEMGHVLLALRESLLRQKEEERKRQEEDEQRNWTARGIARFNEILREAGDDIARLSFTFIRELVHYMEAEAGGLYLVGEEEDTEAKKVLRMTGCYAFDREKHLHREFLFGEGLVGRAAVEKELIYLTELPGSYLRIRSGLGEDQPVSLLLVPLLQSGDVLGVIELASFSEIPGYKQKFALSLGESTGSVISKVYINLQTNRLLLQSRQQTEEMAQRENEMKSRMDEMHRIQEKAEQREKELTTQLNECRKMRDING
ncbi:MAG: GAF domain-containing protein [Bacteroidota bacterium]